MPSTPLALEDVEGADNEPSAENEGSRVAVRFAFKAGCYKGSNGLVEHTFVSPS